MDKIVITNKRILSYYNNTDNDIETDIISFMELREKFTNDKFTNNLQKAIMREMCSLQENVTNIQKTVKNDMNNIINDKFAHHNKDFKETLIDKITLLTSNKMNELLKNIPESFEKSNKSIELLINSIKENVMLELKHNTKNVENNRESINRFVNQFGEKLDNSLKPLTEQVSSMSTSQDEFFNKYNNSSNKGRIEESRLEVVLNKMFPCGEITNTSKTPHACDVEVKRENLPTILVENKSYSTNVNTKEVEKFKRDIKEQKKSGIFLSQHSGITSKKHLHIDIIGDCILVYLHNVNYEPSTIQLGFDIIYGLQPIIKNITNNKKKDDIITNINEILKLNNEYQYFIKTKQNLIQMTTDYHKNMISTLKNISFPNLSSFLSNYLDNENEIAITKDNEIITVCDICNNFKATSQKSLTSHRNHCKKKHNKPSQNTKLTDFIKVDI